jgi:putative MATE family efflux protein
MGDSKTAMYMSLVMNGINVAGNALLIFGFRLGIAGAAIPTLVSRIVVAVVILRMLTNKNKVVHLILPFSFRFDFPLLKKILGIGLPNGLENSMFQLGKILVLSLVSGFGTASIAANAVANSVCSFAIVGGIAMGYAMSAVTAQCVGAGDYLQVRYDTKKLLKYSYAILALMCGFIALILPLILRVYNLTDETAAMARVIILYHSVCAIIAWAPSFNLPSVLRAANDVSYCMIVTTVSMWLFRIGFSFVIGKYMGVGVLGVWIAMTIDWVVRDIFLIARYRGKAWEHKLV